MPFRPRPQHAGQSNSPRAVLVWVELLMKHLLLIFSPPKEEKQKRRGEKTLQDHLVWRTGGGEKTIVIESQWGQLLPRSGWC